MADNQSEQVLFWAVMPAAGSGQRMQQVVAKQYIKIAGSTIIEHSAGVLLANKRIKQLMVSLSPGDKVWPTLSLLNDERIDSTIGGVSRAQSVLNGLNALTEANEQDWVLVHDAARPCLSAAMLSKLLNELENDDVGGTLALPVKDTLKVAQSDMAGKNVSLKTLDRRQIWQAQTPQMFRYSLLKNALQQALDNNAEITDEASAMEWAGYQPKLIEGDARNLKVTTPEDLVLAEFLLTQG